MAVEVSISSGLDPAIDRVAAKAHPTRRFLSHSWFAAAGSREVRTILLSSTPGDPLIALPVSAGLLRAVPGGYWPFRSFPAAADTTAEDMAALLLDRQARRALGPIWRIGPVYENDPALTLLRDAAPKAGWRLYERTISTAYVLDMKSLAAEGEWPRSSTLRKNRFHEKHLARHGQLEWLFARGSDWTPDLFADLAAIEAKSWHAGASDPKFLPGPHRRLWERLARDPDQAARMNAAILSIDGKPAAFSFDLDVGDRKYAIANSYDPAYAKHSPGKCLYYRNLVEAKARGITLVDWGAGDGGYKQTIGAVAGPRIVDCLIVRTGWLTPILLVIGLIWKATSRNH